MSRWAVEMAEALRGDGSGGADGSWRFATVNTASPLTIKAHDQVISKYPLQKRLPFPPGRG